MRLRYYRHIVSHNISDFREITERTQKYASFLFSFFFMKVLIVAGAGGLKQQQQQPGATARSQTTERQEQNTCGHAL